MFCLWQEIMMDITDVEGFVCACESVRVCMRACVRVCL